MKNEKGEDQTTRVFDAAIFDHFAHAVMDEMIRQCSVQEDRSAPFRAGRTRLYKIFPLRKVYGGFAADG